MKNKKRNFSRIFQQVLMHSFLLHINIPSIFFLPRQLMTELANRLNMAVAAPTIIEYMYTASPISTCKKHKS
jgi:hypothetical protein